MRLYRLFGIGNEETDFDGETGNGLPAVLT